MALGPDKTLPWDRPGPRTPAIVRAWSGTASGSSASGSGGAGGRARIREAPADELQAPVAAAVTRQPWYQVVDNPQQARTRPAGGRTQALSPAQARGLQAQAVSQQAAQQQAPRKVALPATRTRLPYVAANPAGHPVTADGRRNCGPLERILHRQWHEGAGLPAQVVTAISRLADLPRHLQDKLADGLTGIFVGPGGVPDLDDMGALKGVPLPSGKATWDACAGAYGERKLVVGSRLSPTPDVMCHEIGHALDDLDAPAGKWQSDSAEFKAVYDQCKQHLVSDFHRQRGGLGRKEFFADAFAAIASGQRPALVDMLGGDTRTALWVMLYFNRLYEI